MPQNKRILFASNQQTTAQIAMAFCHPARLQIIDLLRQQDFLLCGDLVDQLPLAQATVSHHLNLLLQVNIIVREVQFDAVGYRLNHIGWHEAKADMMSYFAKVG